MQKMKKHGLIKWWYENRQIHSQDSWKNNQQHGILIVFKY